MCIRDRHHQERIYLGNGGFEDLYYKRMNEKVKIVMMECTEGWDTCFCVSMGTNKADDYAAAVRFGDGELLFDVEDQDLAPYFEKMEENGFKPDYIKENEISLTVPEIPDKDVLTKLKSHPMWQEYNGRCISCGACTAVSYTHLDVYKRQPYQRESVLLPRYRDYR